MANPLLDGAKSAFLNLLETCPIVPGAIVSKPLLNRPEGRVVVFAMDAGQELTEHRAPFMTTVQVLDGRLDFTAGGQRQDMGPNDWLVMPPNEPHSLRAKQGSRFLLTFLKVPSPPAT